MTFISGSLEKLRQFAQELEGRPHEHVWVPYGWDDPVSVELRLTGEHCECGAVRQSQTNHWRSL